MPYKSQNFYPPRVAPIKSFDLSKNIGILDPRQLVDSS